MKTQIIGSLIGLLSFFVLGMSPANASGDNTVAKDTILIKYGKTGRITIYAGSEEDKNKLKTIDLNAQLQRLLVYLDSTKKTGTFSISDSTGEVNVSKTAEKDYVVIIGKDYGDRQSGVVISRGNNKNSTYTHSSSRWTLRLSLGLNNYLQDGNIPNGEAYALRPWGSRYFAIGNYLRLSRKDARWGMHTGFEFSWYNFSFDQDIRVRKGDTSVEFQPSTEALDKSKMVVSYLNVPLLIKYQSVNGRFKAGLGGYVGYRLSSYASFRESDERRKTRQHSNLFMNDVRYGLTGEVGRRDASVFFNYDLSPLFSDGRGPQLNVFSFGARWDF